jgi:structural maintenance of chromosome 3 (chondroitin sulfate proteoglycan 6)
VLSDQYTQTSREERQGLLHEGSGSAVMSAYVEIIFDNSDERFPTGNKEVVLRRTIGLKKDEYSLDRKNASRSDVMNLLESAGFSRSNPYYIVPQGRVTTLTNMKDHERLTLLKEVAGTQVYEQRRSESLRIIEDTSNRRAKIDELLKYIEERLSELEDEKEELRGYQEKDKERRCLEYTIYQREQVEIGNALDQIEMGRQRGLDINEDSRETFMQGEERIKELESEINGMKQRTDLSKVDKRQLEDECRELVRNRAQIELDFKALSADQEHSRSAKIHYEQELAEITGAIAEREAELQDLLPEYSQKKEQEQNLKQELAEADAARQRLYARQGRNTKFRTKRERDDWLKQEIKDCRASLAKLEATNSSIDKEIADTEQVSESLENKIQEARDKLDNRSGDLDEVAKDVVSKRDIRNKLMDERKELWRIDAKLDNEVESARQELEKADRALAGTMDNNTSRGLKSVRKIKQRLKLDGCYGTLAELMDVDETYRTAVEVTAGQSLFHYVVDNDDTATVVLQQLQKEKSGRITFMPLNRLKPRLAQYPEAIDAIPMIHKVKFDDRYGKAFEQVFGKTIICPDLNVASQYARSHSVSAITLAGDRADKKGALTGGYHDPRRSRLEAVKAVKYWQEEFEARRAEAQKIKHAIELKDQEITLAVGELQKAEARRTQAENSYGPLRSELQGMVASLGQLNDSLERKKRSKDNGIASLKSLQEQLEAYQTELKSEFKKSLTSEEEKSLEELAQRCQELRKEVGQISTERAEKESRKAIIEVELRENLRMRLDQLKGQSMDNLETGNVGRGGRRTDLNETKQELERVEKSISATEARVTEIENATSTAMVELKRLDQEMTELQTAQQEEARNIERQKKRIEKSLSKRALLQEKAAECSRNIRDLGVLPDEAFEKYANVDSNKVVRLLHKVNDALKKFSHVNKKAFEQYNNFTKQRDMLQKRREELDKSHASIEDLIQVLDQRKDEAIERTFRQVSKDFAEIFEKLVPRGRGRLIIQRKADKKTWEEDDEDSEEDDERQKSSVENYAGVGITVSFNSRENEQLRLQQLSGGQKSLCMPL